ncbi:sigma factor-like helix-turn-helix DNA-binding protein [Microbacterium sp. NPDC028030]|uniref:response regulator transcription factor n=1 Tax=Microbacterium sp. NPDC028030 TaxID=3155124 RepID=UPI0033C8019B
MHGDSDGARRVRRAAVVDESVLQRTRVGQLLSQELRLEVVHATATVGQFLAWIERTDRTRWPHLLVIALDIHPGSSRDLTVIAALRAAGIRVLALLSSRSRVLTNQLVTAGIDAVVATADDEDAFLAAAQTVLSGGSTISAGARPPAPGPEGAPRLSRQEERVLALYASGLTIAEVAERIGVRHDTARKYLQRVRDKLSMPGRPARSKLELARIAWAEGYVLSIDSPPHASSPH